MLFAKNFEYKSTFKRKWKRFWIIGLKIQWNQVNTDTKGTCHSVRIIRVSVLSGLSEKTAGTHVLSI